MKTNTLKITTLCIICAATLLSGCIESNDIAEDITDNDSEGLPITAMIKGALPNDFIRFILEEDGTMEQCARGECSYGTWKLRDTQTENSRTYDLDMEPQCVLTVWDDGTATIDVTGGPVQFKGTWVEGIDKSWGGSSSSSSTPTPTPTPTPSGPLVTELWKFDHAINSDVDVWKYNFNRTDEYTINKYSDAEEIVKSGNGKTFVIVMSHITNVGDDVVVSGAKDFTAVDSAGNKYDPKRIDDYGKMAYSCELQPGDNIADYVIFEVPEDSTGLRLQYYIGDDIGTASWEIQR